MFATASQTAGYVPVNDLDMYYEVHGAATAKAPLLLLHGSMGTLEMFGPLLPALAESRQVIAPEQQAHGHTADIDRPLRYEQMADDTAALLKHIGVDRVDVFGFSMGAGVAVQLAIRHPILVRKLVNSCATYTRDHLYTEVLSGLGAQFSIDMFAGTPIEAAYRKVAPRPDDFPVMIARVLELTQQTTDWPVEDFRAITAPTLLIAGDADIIRPEGVVELFRIQGGGVPGDFMPMPSAQLAVLPGTTHMMLPTRTEWLHSMIVAFLDAPLPERKQGDLLARS